MSETTRRRRPEGSRNRSGNGQAGAPQLQIPQREDAELDRESARLAQMAAMQGRPGGGPQGEPAAYGAGNPGMPVPGGGTQGWTPDPLHQFPPQGMQSAGTDPLQRPSGLPGESAVRTAGEEEAYQLGAKMGAESLANESGAVTQIRQRAMPIDEKRIIEAERILMEYKGGKSSVDLRIIGAQQWWKVKNWEQIQDERGTKGSTEQKSATAWLWNCIVQKHAEAMDSYPSPIILPRMEEDKAEAEILSSIIPVILSNNGFEKVYSDGQWQKFQEGTGAYYVGWDKTKLGGLGDISVRNVSMLNLFWEPGIEDIEDSENLFYVQIVNTRQLEMQYPRLKGRLESSHLKPSEYIRDDSVSDSGKSVLVDWYYHVWEGNRKILHYCQFVNHEILYSTENEGDAEGLYTDGEYPFVLDPLFPVHGSPAGYGLIDIAKDTQMDIDTLNQAMVQNAVVTSTPRWLIQGDGGINEAEYADWSKPFVHITGPVGEQHLRQIETAGIQGSALQMLANKIDELKAITGATDVTTGSTPSGVTAASAIAALQEAHGRTSKDSSRSSYRACDKITAKTIERVRQGYDIPRQFRILGPNGQQKFVEYSNAKLKEQVLMGGLGMPQGYRKPVFDIDIRSERESSYTRIAQNEMMMQFYQMGAFNPQMADQILLMMTGMDFPGKEELVHKIEQNGTMLQALMKIGQIAMALAGKHDPAIAAQLMPVLQSLGIDAGMMPAGGGRPAQLLDQDATGEISDANTMVANARDRSQESVRPE